MAIDPNEIKDKVDTGLDTGKNWVDKKWRLTWFPYVAGAVVILLILFALKGCVA